MFPHHWAATVRRSTLLFLLGSLPLSFLLSSGISFVALGPPCRLPCQCLVGGSGDPCLVLRSASFAGSVVCVVFYWFCNAWELWRGVLERLVSNVARNEVLSFVGELCKEPQHVCGGHGESILAVGLASHCVPCLGMGIGLSDSVEDVQPWVFSARRGAFTGFFFHQLFVLGRVKRGGIEA